LIGKRLDLTSFVDRPQRGVHSFFRKDQEMSEKKKILFLCTGNSCRSQMAEAWTRHLHGSHFDPYSAGIEVRRVDPRAVLVMSEKGVDISEYRSKHVESIASIDFDYVSCRGFKLDIIDIFTE